MVHIDTTTFPKLPINTHNEEYNHLPTLTNNKPETTSLTTDVPEPLKITCTREESVSSINIDNNAYMPTTTGKQSDHSHTHKNRKRGTFSNQIKVMYTNCRGLKGKKTSIVEILDENQPHLFLLTETQLRNNSGGKIDGYEFYSRIRKEGSGGGVGIYVRNDLKSNATTIISTRNIEIIWVSIHRKGLSPILIGTYYGKQETRTNKSEIEKEMQLLNEEIEEMKKEGEILLAMDGNAKIGLLGEPISRNGKLLLQLVENTNLKLVNNTSKCKGRITRVNTKNPDEYSAIDFLLATENAEKWITEMLIDEDGLYKLKGKNETDHNTICIDINISNIEKTKLMKHVGWNINAPQEKWEDFKNELDKRRDKATQIITDKSQPLQKRYNMWLREIENAARETIGKTTFKEGKFGKTSEEIKKLRQMKKDLKKEIKIETDKEKRDLLILDHKKIQETTREEIVREKTEQIKKKLENIINDTTGKTFWGLKRQMTRDPTLESMAVKDKHGQRQFSPEGIKEATADYYQDLYKDKKYPFHPYHSEVEEKIKKYTEDDQHEDTRYNQPPTVEEITKIINLKKNGKSTPEEIETRK